MGKQRLSGKSIDPLRRCMVTQWPLVGAAAVAGWEARAAPRPREVLKPDALALLSAWCDTLVPGAQDAGVADFIATQLVRPRQRAGLTLRYLDWPGPYDAFYRAGLAALDASARSAYGKPFLVLDAAQRAELAGRVASGAAQAWDGPPAGLFYFATRADAVDVVYGTVDGFARLDVPYRAHIAPPRGWPAR